MAKCKRPIWGDRFGKRPIERYFRRDDPTQGEVAEDEALAELDRRIARLAEYYGVRTYRDLARRLAGEIHPAFTIIDPKPKRKATGITAAKWRGQMGIQLVDLVEDIRNELRRSRGGRRVTWKHVLGELIAPSMEATTSTIQLWAQQHGAMPDFRRMSP